MDLKVVYSLQLRSTDVARIDFGLWISGVEITLLTVHFSNGCIETGSLSYTSDYWDCV